MNQREPAEYVSAAEIFPRWRESVLSGGAPRLYPVGTGELTRIEVGPGRLMVIGGGPAFGKTAWVMQMLIDMLRMTFGLVALVCNVEMQPEALLERQLARLSGVDGTEIRLRRGQARYRARLERGLDTLAPLASRLGFVTGPYTLARILTAMQRMSADVLVIDYLQRIKLDESRSDDSRGTVNAIMDGLRALANAGKAVIVVSAVGRSKDRNGRVSYDADALNLASFRESSELEYGADDAYLIVPYGDDGGVKLRHLKSRYGSQQDLVLQFHRACQRFYSLQPNLSQHEPSAGRVASTPDATDGTDMTGGRQ